MIWLEKFVHALRCYGLARLSIKRLEAIQSDLRERIHSERVLVSEIDRRIADLLEQKLSIPEDVMEDKAELAAHILHLQSREDEVRAILNTRRVKSPFYAS